MSYGRTRKEVKRDKEDEYGKIVKHGARLEAEKAFNRPAYGSIDAVEYYRRKGIELSEEGEVKTAQGTGKGETETGTGDMEVI